MTGSGEGGLSEPARRKLAEDGKYREDWEVWRNGGVGCAWFHAAPDPVIVLRGRSWGEVRARMDEFLRVYHADPRRPHAAEDAANALEI